jgi:hypothetical protein
MTGLPYPFGRLNDRAVLAVTGEDATNFLHGLLTADVRDLRPGEARYGALLTAQGKIMFDLFVIKTEEGFLLDCEASRRDEIAKQLNFYKLRAKVTITSRDDLAVGASSDKPPAPLSFADPRHAGLGWRALAPQTEIPAGDGSGHRLARFALGIADSAEIGSSIHYPHEANFDQLHGVSFSKGCFVGQEVVSRMEHRGSAKSRICPVEIDGDDLGPSLDIKAGDKTVGTLLSREGNRGLALIRLDRLGEAVASGEPLLTGMAKIRVLKPSWAEFEVAGS